ncbi:maltase A1-like [Arctopsyche grandis]|uniref:maltase A1-like n=1 Tax=Arctopsyche grandis TaxID=121162 RepID=UPI00406D7302
MFKLVSVIFFIIMASGCHGDWWETMQLYQIYPRSFLDSDGDGIGDLKGIPERLSYFDDIGVNAVWLSPIFVSPMKDFGYDISDFYKIAEEYGTIDDLKRILTEAKKLDIKILLDFVPNHSSDQCEWFQKSIRKEPGFENFYVWHPGRENPAGGRRLPPSNWVSVFRNSAWTWHPVRQEYYLHQFLPEQPDLNYRDPNVVAEMKNVLRFWLSVGVDGFRVDAIPHLVEVDVDATGNYPDEPLSGATDDENDYSYLEHIHTREREETFSMVYDWRKTLDDYASETQTSSKVLLMEAMSDVDIVMQYYGNATHEGAHFPFNFLLAFLNKEAKANKLKQSIDEWFSKIPEGRVTNWVAGNHDQPRLATRYGPERSDGVVMMAMLLPGVSVTYQGEEIGMENFYLSYEDTQDPQACKDGPDMYNITSRDPARTPFQWNTTKNSGFSDADKTWLPVADNYLTLNLDSQLKAPASAYKMYEALAQLRRTEAIQNGSFQIEALNDDVLVFTRTSGFETYVVVINTDKDNLTVNLRSKFPNLDNDLIISTTSVKSPKIPGFVVSANNLELVGYEALVLRSIS